MESFKALNSCVFLHEPASTVPVPSLNPSPSPTTVLFFPWMGAQPRHFSKFLAHYIAHYPTARILVFLSWNLHLGFPSYFRHDKLLEPGLQIILTDLNTDNEGKGDGFLLAHAFSNGGAIALTSILLAFRRRTNRAMPLQALILDSAPGRANLRPIAAAMRMSLPKQGYLQLPIIVFVFSLLSVLWVFHCVFHIENAIDKLRRVLNEPRVLSLKTKRCYVYSRADKLVKWTDVEEHIDEAARQGYDVIRKEFHGSEHVSHMRMDKVKYWSVLESIMSPVGGEANASTSEKSYVLR